MQELDFVDYLHGIFERVQGAGRLDVHACHEIRGKLKRAKARFPKKHHAFLNEVVEHANSLEYACTMLNTRGAIPAGTNPDRSKYARERRDELTWFSNNALRVNDLASRPWTSRKVWAMRVAGSLVVAALIGTVSWVVNSKLNLATNSAIEERQPDSTTSFDAPARSQPPEERPEDTDLYLSGSQEKTAEPGRVAVDEEIINAALRGCGGGWSNETESTFREAIRLYSAEIPSDGKASSRTIAAIIDEINSDEDKIEAYDVYAACFQRTVDALRGEPNEM